MMLEKRRADIEAASNLQSIARSYLQSLGVDRQSYEFVLGCFDTRLAEFVNKKSQSGRPQYESFAKICAAFIVDIKQAFGAIAAGAPFPFAQEPQTTPASGSSSREVRIVELGTTGIVKDSALKAKGFDLGVEVVGPEGTPHHIKEFGETHVVLSNSKAKTSRQTITVAKNVLLTKWVVHAPAEEKRVPVASPAKFGADHTKEVLNTSVRMLLHEAALLEGTTSGLEFANPFPTVWATRSVAKGALIRIPYTTHITIVAK